MNINELSTLVAEAGFPVMMEEYESEPLVYPLLCDVEPHRPDQEFGFKASIIIGIGDFRERTPGNAYEADELIEGPEYYLKVRDLGRRLVLDERMVDHVSAARPGEIGDLIEEAAASAGRGAREASEQLVADILQKGTLSAGHLATFNNTFVENNTVTTDPYPTKIYDGKAFFATDHPITVGSSTFSNINTSLALDEKNYATSRGVMRMSNNRNERNQKIRIAPDVLLVPPSGSMERIALQIVGSQLVPGSANNDTNTSRGTAQVLSWSYLDDAASASTWWLGQRGRGIKVRDSGDPETIVAFDPIKRQYHVMFRKKFGASVHDWRYWYCNNKATS